MTDRTAAEALQQIIDRYESQAKFADVDPASYFREFVRLLKPILTALTAEAARVSPGREALANDLEREAGYIDDALAEQGERLLILATEPAKRIANKLAEAAVALRLPAQAEVEQTADALEEWGGQEINGVVDGGYLLLRQAAAMLRRLSALPPAVGEWRPITDEMSQFLNGITGVVDANSYETLCLHQAARGRCETWISDAAGFHETIGHCAGMPVCITLHTATVKCQKLLFVDAVSQVIDHRMIDGWLNNACPQSARRPGGYINRVDAMNFHNVFLPPAPPQETKP